MKKFPSLSFVVALLIAAVAIGTPGHDAASESGTRPANTKADKFAAPPPQEPILRIEPGMHTGRIWRIGVDRACTIMATGSDDKTVRLWSLVPDVITADASVQRVANRKARPASSRTGPGTPRLLRTIRPPIGEGNNGKVFALALSPDGTRIAAGGWNRSGGDHWVYIYEARSGKLLRRMGRFSNVITSLAYSRDGRFLAAGLGSGGGMRAWDTSTWKMVARDTKYGGQNSMGAAFDSTGRLFTVGYDGYLRRYGTNLKLEAKVRALGGKRAFSIAIHPDDDRFAIGYSENTNVEVYDARTMQRLFAADTQGAKSNLSKLGWSADGTKLYAAGKFQNKGKRVFRVWPSAGIGPARDHLVGPTDTVMQLLPCGNGMAFGAQDPSFGLLNADDKPILWRPRPIADMRGKRYKEFMVSDDGKRVRFRLNYSGGTPIMFDLASESVTESAKAPADLHQPPIKGLNIKNWLNKLNPSFNGQVIKLQSFERSRSLSIVPDNSRFILGTEYHIRAYDASGPKAKQIWSRAVPGIAWGTNLARNGRVTVIAHGDGTVRWYRTSDGAELLAFFILPQDQRWVAWTPKGYYMASPGGEELIGWHVNRDWLHTANFFSVDRFRDQFNRPDIVKRVLETEDEERAIEASNRDAGRSRAKENIRAALPPIIVIQKPEENATFSKQEVTLQYFAISPSGTPLTNIDVRIDGATLGARAAIPMNPRSAEPIKLTLTLPPRDVTVTLVARDGDRASEPASINLRWDGAKPGEVRKPRLRALLVGVSKYKQNNLRLKFAHKDASDLASFFKSQKGRSYRDVDVRLLPDASRADVLEGLDWLEKGSEEGDISVLFMAGHGQTDASQHFYFLPADANPASLRATAISKDEILRTIRRRRGTMVVFIDACHSGAGLESDDGLSKVDMHRLVNELGDKALGVFLYASSTGRQFSYEHDSWGNGAFTKALIEGLKGKADRYGAGDDGSRPDGIVESDELNVYVRLRVKALTKKRQIPVAMKPQAVTEIELASR